MLYFSCTGEQDPYLVSRSAVGMLTDTTQVKDLKTVFPNDSIVNYKGDSTFKIPMNLVEVYAKSGQLLLSLTPEKMMDSTSRIKNIRIEDERYKTEEKISKASRFKDIQKVYKISKIDNLINSLVISVDELNAQFAIDKTELPAQFRYDMRSKIEATQIPENARIKYFFINWN